MNEKTVLNHSMTGGLRHDSRVDDARAKNVRRNAIAATTDNVLPFYLQKANAGQRVCLVTLYQVDSVAPRPVGSQIAVAEDGESFGFITGGCAEAAIVHESLMALRENRSRRIRIGSESPWFDIKLPCGAGIDLHFSVADSRAVIDEACGMLSIRQPVLLRIDTVNDNVEFVCADRQRNLENKPEFVREYLPQPRLAIIGAGPYVNALATLASQSEFEILVWSPEQETGSNKNTSRSNLLRTSKLPEDTFDRWSAAILLFHEHDWEPKLLKTILATNCFYIGALGSRKAHASRLNQLRAMGVDESQLQRIHGPVGLPINAKTPSEIAVSILAEVIEIRNSEIAN